MLRAYPPTGRELMNAPPAADPIRACLWREEMQVDDVAWETDCGNLFEFSADGPLENSFKFCPYCGGHLQVAPSRRNSGNS